MQRKSTLIRVVATLAIFLLFVLHIAGTPEIRFFTQLENLAYDARVRLTLAGKGETDVVIVDIDERSIAAEGQWPWARDKLALLTERLVRDYDARVVGYDMNFPEPDRNSGDDVLQALADSGLANDPAFERAAAALRPSLRTDQRFAAALRQAPVVLGFVFRHYAFDDVTNELGVLPSPTLRQDQLSPGMEFHVAGGYTGNLPVIQESASSGGFYDNPVIDRDGVFRRVPAVQQYNGNLYASLALELVRAVHGWAPLEFVFEKGASAQDNLHLEGLRIDDLRIPVDDDVALYVPYRGASFTFPYVSATDVLSRTAAPESLRDRIVLVGTSAPGLLDMRVTPVSERFVGVEVHANIVDGVLGERIKFFPPYTDGIHVSLLLLLGIVLTFVLWRYSVIPATAITVALLVTWIATSFWLWQRFDFIVPLATPLLFGVLVFGIQILYGLLIESRGKRYLSQMFGQYIPPELVEEMDRSQQEISLDGESREMSVLFSDVRGFTGVSEGLDPKQLTHLMNEFLTPLTGVIHENRGTIDKYMGDAVMAFWGAPLDDDEHAAHAVAAALQMVSVMRRLGPVFKDRGWPELRVGVGVNTGVMNVGNMGSEFRMAYTVMGDAVNLGSRLEGLTKAYGVEIIVSEFTRDAAPEYAYLELDRVRVKGREEPLAIYEPLGLRGALPKESKHLRARHKQALMLYRNQQWDAAEREFFSLAQTEPDRALYRIYLERIAHFRQNPPPANWEGVFTFATK